MMEKFPQSSGSGQSCSFVTVTKGHKMSVEKPKYPKSHPVLTFSILTFSILRERLSPAKRLQGSPLSSSRNLILTRPVQDIWVMLIHADFQSHSQQNQTVQNQDFALSTFSGRKKRVWPASLIFSWEIHWGHEIKKSFDSSGMSSFIPLFLFDFELGFQMALEQAHLCHYRHPLPQNINQSGNLEGTVRDTQSGLLNMRLQHLLFMALVLHRQDFKASAQAWQRHTSFPAPGFHP